MKIGSSEVSEVSIDDHLDLAFTDLKGHRLDATDRDVGLSPVQLASTHSEEAL